MNPTEDISRALHCINTGQPNLANLYMRRAERGLVTLITPGDLLSWRFKHIERGFMSISAAFAAVFGAVERDLF